MMPPVFIDTNVPMYAGGRPHPCRDAAREVIRSIVLGDIEAFTDSEVLQEILYRYFAINEKARGLAIFDSFAAIMKGRILAITEEDILLARQFAETFVDLTPRDLVHLAVMRNHGISRVVTADAGFDGVDWVQRISLQDSSERR